MDKINFHLRSGTALVEMILVIPLLATIIGVTYFFGWSLMNQQQVRTLDRYLTWRGVYNTAGSSPVNFTQEELNSNFFNGRATINAANSIAVTSGTTLVIGNDFQVLDTRRDFVDMVSAANQQAGSLADLMVNSHWPGGWGSIVEAQFPSSIGLWNKFQGSITTRRANGFGRTGREGLEWRYRQAQQSAIISQYYFENLSSTMDGVQGPAAPMADMIKRLYQQGW